MRKHKTKIYRLSCGHTVPLKERRAASIVLGNAGKMMCGQCHEEVELLARGFKL